MKNKYSKIISVIMLVLIILSSMPFDVFANNSSKKATEITARNNKNLQVVIDGDIDSNYEKIASRHADAVIEPWHYSGGYWAQVDKVRGGYIYQIFDWEIPEGNLSTLEGIIQRKTGGYPIDVEYPNEVKKALREGKKVKVKMKARKNNLPDYIKNIKNPKSHKLVETRNGFTLRSPLKFNYQETNSGRTIFYNNFGLYTGRLKLPVVKEGFGANTYSIFNRSGGRPVEWASYWNWGETAKQGKIHPSIIYGNGLLKSGYNIDTTRGRRKSQNIRVGDGTFNSGGAVGINLTFPFEFEFYVEKDINSNILLKELELVDKNGEVIDSFKREVDPKDPFNEKKHRTIRTRTFDEAPILKRGEEYTLRSKYQFISYEKGEFDISKPESMTKEQRQVSTKINKNKLDVFYSYDDLVDKSDKYNAILTMDSIDKPKEALKNLEEATFEWRYIVPEDVEEYMTLSVKVPKYFDKVNDIKSDDWGMVLGKVGQENLILTDMYLIDPDDVDEFKDDELSTTGILDSFKRRYKLEDAFNLKNHKVIKSSPTKEDAPRLERGKKYIIEAQYQYVSSELGLITSEEEMTKEQAELSTNIDRNMLNKYYAYDDNVGISGVYDEIGYEWSTNKGDVELKNLETAIFRWEYEVPLKEDNIVNEYIEIRSKVPEIEPYKSVNRYLLDDWGLVKGLLFDNDIAATEPVELYQDDKKIKKPVRNEEQSVEFSFEHVFGDDIIGEDPDTNPKLTVDFEVVDELGNVLLEETKTSKELLHPKETIKMKTSEFTPKHPVYRACATINPIHKKLGYNGDTKNDRMCKIFGIEGPDIAMVEPTIMLVDQKEAEHPKSGAMHQVIFNVEHVEGDEILGLDPVKNPPVRIKTIVSDGKREQVEYITLNKPLKPGEKASFKQTKPFITNEPMIHACAYIDPIHNELGYNNDLSNDEICKVWSTTRNFYVKDFQAIPGDVLLDKSGRTNKDDIDISLKFTVGYEDIGDETDISKSPIVQIRDSRGGVLWSDRVTIPPNGTTSDTIVVPGSSLSKGVNKLIIEINPKINGVREFKEYGPNLSTQDIYKDNIDICRVNFYENQECQECLLDKPGHNVDTENEWKERIDWREYRWRCYTSTDSETGEQTTHCGWSRFNSYSKIEDYEESFSITGVKLQSKYTVDNNLGDAANYTSPGAFKVKAGNSFDIKVGTHYRTNRNYLPPKASYSTNSYKLVRSPNEVAKHHLNEAVFLYAPFGDTSNEQVCYVLGSEGNSGPWYDLHKVWSLLSKDTIGANSGRGGFYVPFDVKPGRYPFELTTSIVNGYPPVNFVSGDKDPLQDCSGFSVEIAPQDDMKSHISQ